MIGKYLSFFSRSTRPINLLSSIFLLVAVVNFVNGLRCYDNLEGGPIKVLNGCKFCMIFDKDVLLEQSDDRETIALCGRDSYPSQANSVGGPLHNLCLGVVEYAREFKSSVIPHLSSFGSQIMSFRAIVTSNICEKDLCNDRETYVLTTRVNTSSSIVMPGSGSGVRCYEGFWLRSGTDAETEAKVPSLVLEKHSCKQCMTTTQIVNVESGPNDTRPLLQRTQLTKCITDETFRNDIEKLTGKGSTSPTPSENALTTCKDAGLTLNARSTLSFLRIKSLVQLSIEFCNQDLCNHFTKFEKRGIADDDESETQATTSSSELSPTTTRAITTSSAVSATIGTTSVISIETQRTPTSATTTSGGSGGSNGPNNSISLSNSKKNKTDIEVNDYDDTSAAVVQEVITINALALLLAAAATKSLVL